MHVYSYIVTPIYYTIVITSLHQLREKEEEERKAENKPGSDGRWYTDINEGDKRETNDAEADAVVEKTEEQKEQE